MTDSLIGVVAMVCDGLYQRDLADKIAGRFRLLGLVVHCSPPGSNRLVERLRRLTSPLKALRQIGTRLALRSYRRRGANEMDRLFRRDNGEWPNFPDVPVCRVTDINDLCVAPFVQGLSPDVVVVNGTNLLRRALRDAVGGAPLGIVNLHTGLSPYARGGNCNLWVLSEGRPEEVGVTVHYIDGGIDRGDILLSERVPLVVNDCHESIDARTFHFGNVLVLKALELLVEGRAPRVAQWTEGKLYLQRTGYTYSPEAVLKLNRQLAAGLIQHYIDGDKAAAEHVRLVSANDDSPSSQQGA